MAKWKNILEKDDLTQTLTQKEILEFWEKELKELEGYTVFFEGGLGAGKSFWSREILKLSGIKEEIPSPTYTYVQEYSNGTMNFAHFDLYRIEDFEGFLEKGFEEIISTEQTACLVEWPQNIGKEHWGIFPSPCYIVRLQIQDDKRGVVIEKKQEGASEAP